MKNTFLITFAALLSGLFFMNCFMFPDSQNELPLNTKIELPADNGFAVVELFTSEGCSSCPPADQLLEKLQEDAKGKNVYLMAYHVDYWDRLGWKDQFSSNEFTKRQQKYQDWLNLSVMYTPQFIINGTSEFAGYNETALYEKVAGALKTKQTGNLKLTVKTTEDAIVIDFKTNQIPQSSNLFIATVQKQGSSKVQRGENKGNTLHHVQIVRAIKSFPLTKTEGKITIKKPSNFETTEWELLGFVQNTATGKISITTKADLHL